MKNNNFAALHFVEENELNWYLVPDSFMCLSLLYIGYLWRFRKEPFWNPWPTRLLGNNSKCQLLGCVFNCENLSESQVPNFAQNRNFNSSCCDFWRCRCLWLLIRNFFTSHLLKFSIWQLFNQFLIDNNNRESIHLVLLFCKTGLI